MGDSSGRIAGPSGEGRAMRALVVSPIMLAERCGWIRRITGRGLQRVLSGPAGHRRCDRHAAARRPRAVGSGGAAALLVRRLDAPADGRHGAADRRHRAGGGSAQRLGGTGRGPAELTVQPVRTAAGGGPGRAGRTAARGSPGGGARIVHARVGGPRCQAGGGCPPSRGNRWPACPRRSSKGRSRYSSTPPAPRGPSPAGGWAGRRWTASATRSGGSARARSGMPGR